MNHKKTKKTETNWRPLWIFTSVCGILSLILFLGAFTGLDILNKNVIRLMIGKAFRPAQPFSCYIFDACYFFFIWGAIVYIIRNFSVLLQIVSAIILFIVPIAAHILINTYGPWYAETAEDAIVLYVIFAILIIPGFIIENISEFIKKKKLEH